MAPREPLTAPLERRLRRIGTTPGQLTWSTLAVVVLSGVALGVLYDPAAPLASVELIQEAIPFGWLLRATHRLAAQAFLVLLVLHTVDHVIARNHRAVTARSWWQLVLVLGMGFAAMFGGFLLRGDAEAQAARAIAQAVTRAVPLLGDDLVAFLWGDGTLIPVYLHHLVTFTLLPWLLAIEHGRRSWAGWLITASTLAVVTAVALVHHPGPGGFAGQGGPLWGPWYFVGLQELLRWLPVWLAAWGLPLFAVLLLGGLGHFGRDAEPAVAATADHRRRFLEPGLRWALLALGAAYLILSLVAWLARRGG